MASEGFRRKLAAILSADAAGYSRLMNEDEEATVRTLKAYRKMMSALIGKHQGRLVDSPGDNLLAEFGSVVDAIRCAWDIQNEIKEKNAGLAENRRMLFRIGINIGDVIEEEGRIYGDGVNVAARLESLAKAGGISISGTAYDQVKTKSPWRYEYHGEQKLKNIKDPVRVYCLVMESEDISQEHRRDYELPDRPSIAVLPFSNMSGDPEQEYFSDGITEDIITALSRSAFLFVIARNSSFFYRGKSINVKTISKELGVRYILEGSIRKSGNRLRVTAQLVDGTLGDHVWAEKYDGELRDIFELQDEITQKVAASILTQIPIDLGEKISYLERPTLKTWDLLARAWKLLYELTEESLTEGETILRTAVASAPSSCHANYLLAATLIHQVHMGCVSDKNAVISHAYQLSKRAVALEERSEYAHWAFGLVELYRRNHDKAINEFERAIELNPNCSVAYGSLGTALGFSGEPDESIKYNEIAIRLSPKDISIFFRFSGIAMAHYLAGRYSEAEKWARNTIYRKPNWHMGHTVLAASLAQLNQLKEAKEAVDDYLQIFPSATIAGARDLPFKNPKDSFLLEEGLRKAGLK